MARRKSVKFSAKPVHEPDALLHGTSMLTGDLVAEARRAEPEPNLQCGLCGRAVYRVVYALSFGCVFSTMLVSRLVPGREIIARGLGDGAAAAKRAAKGVAASSDTIPVSYVEAVAGLDPAGTA